MFNASDDWKSAFIAAILGEDRTTAEPASHQELKGIANVLRDRAEDTRLGKREPSLDFSDWNVV